MKFEIKQVIFLLIGAMAFVSGCKKNVPNTTPNASFAKIYAVEGTQVLLGSLKAPDGGYLLWGSSFISNDSGPNGYLMKLDVNQNLVWQKMMGGNKKDEIRSACYDNQGNIMATGMSLSLNDAPSMYTVYLSGDGTIIWEKYYTAPSKKPNVSTVANKVLYLPNGNFALVGSTNNYKSTILYVNLFRELLRPFILTINNKGDTIGSASYDVLLDDRKDGRCYAHVDGTNAVLTRDGSILLFVVRDCSFADSTKKQLIFYYSNNAPVHVGGANLIKMNPNLHFGYNNYIWKRHLPDIGIHIDYSGGNYFYPTPFKMMNTPVEQYMLGYPTLTGTKVNYALFDEEGQLISSAIPSTALQKEYTTDLEFIDGSFYLLSPYSFSKMNPNGQLEWSQEIQSTFSTKFVSGIYLQEDKSLLIFCTALNSKLNTDIGCIKFNASGEILN